MTVIALTDVTSTRTPGAHADALVVVHGRSVGCKFELRRRQIALGGGAGDDVRLEGLAPCVARLDRTPGGWSVTRLANTLDIAIDGQATTMRAPLPPAAELWIDNSILRLVVGDVEAYHDVLFRVSTVDAVTAVANHRWWQDLVARDRVRADRAGVPLSVAMFRLLGTEKLRVAHGPIAAHRLLRAIAVRLRATLGDRPIGRLNGTTFAVLLEGNLDARYPFVDALRRALAEVEVPTRLGPTRLDAVAALADLPQTLTLTDLEARAFERLDRAESASDRRLVLVGWI